MSELFLNVVGMSVSAGGTAFKASVKKGTEVDYSAPLEYSRISSCMPGYSGKCSRFNSKLCRYAAGW